MYAHIYTYHGTHVEVRDSLWESVFTLHHGHPKSPPQTIRLCGKHHHILGYLTAHTPKRLFKMRTEIQSRFTQDSDTIYNIFISLMTIIYL